MFKFELFAEWRNRTIYGESLKAALAAEKTLQRPDILGRGAANEPGEIVAIAKVLGEQDTTNHSRGGKKYISVLFRDANGKIHDVDAVAVAVKLT